MKARASIIFLGAAAAALLLSARARSPGEIDHVQAPLPVTDATTDRSTSAARQPRKAPCTPPFAVPKEAEPRKKINEFFDAWVDGLDSIWGSHPQRLLSSPAMAMEAIQHAASLLLETSDWDKHDAHTDLATVRPRWVLRRMAALDVLSHIVQVKGQREAQNAALAALEQIVALGLGGGSPRPIHGGLLAEACEAMEMLARHAPGRAQKLYAKHRQHFDQSAVLDYLKIGLHDAQAMTTEQRPLQAAHGTETLAGK